MSQPHPKIVRRQQRCLDAEIRCRKCEYDLRDLPESRCPECGTGFDPNDPTTYVSKESIDGKRLLTLALLVVALLCSGPVAGWLAHRWFFESGAIACFAPIALFMMLFAMGCTLTLFFDLWRISSRWQPVRNPRHARAALWVIVIACLWCPISILLSFILP